MKDFRLLGILLLALALRAIMLQSVFTDVGRAQTPDSGDYENLASDWMFAGYSSVPRLPSPPRGYAFYFRPETFRTPGYPALLLGAKWIADPFAEKSVGIYNTHPAPADKKVILSFQVLLDLHLVLLTFFLGRSLAGHRAGLLAALLQAVSPLAAAASCRILTDSIFAFMLIAAVVLLLRHFRTGVWWPLFSAALVMGVACYVRPVGLAFSAIMALVIICSRRGMGVSPMPRPEAPSFAEATEGKRPRRLLRTTAFGCIVVACVAPWIARNATVADYWGFSSFATDSMYWYSAAEIESRQQHKSVEEIRKQFQQAEGWPGGAGERQWTCEPSPYSFTPGALARYRWDKARAIILAHPWEFLDIHLRGDVAFWLPGAPDALEVLGYTSGGKGTLNVLHRQGLVAAAKHYFGDNATAMALAGVMVVLLLVRYAGIILCGLLRLRPRMSVAGWLCLLLVLTAWLLPGPANHPRFRVPVEPILSVAAAIGYLGLLEWRRRRAAGET